MCVVCACACACACVSLSECVCLCVYVSAVNMLTHNYINNSTTLSFDRTKNRRAHGVDLQGAIVIIDEAHNIVGCTTSYNSWILQFAHVRSRCVCIS